MNLKRLNLKSFLGIITICIIQGVCLSCGSSDISSDMTVV